MIPDELKGVLAQSPDVMSGSICFVGTRIPVKILLDNYVEGVPLNEFMDAYPDVTLQQIKAVLHWQDHQSRIALGLEAAS